jgi:hypothetical protein
MAAQEITRAGVIRNVCSVANVEKLFVILSHVIPRLPVPPCMAVALLITWCAFHRCEPHLYCAGSAPVAIRNPFKICQCCYGSPRTGLALLRRDVALPLNPHEESTARKSQVLADFYVRDFLCASSTHALAQPRLIDAQETRGLGGQENIVGLGNSGHEKGLPSRCAH